MIIHNEQHTKSPTERAKAFARMSFHPTTFTAVMGGMLLAFLITTSSTVEAGIWPWGKKKEETAAPKDQPQSPPRDIGNLNAGIRNLLLDAHAAYQKDDLEKALRMAQRAEKLAKASTQVTGKESELQGIAARFVAEISQQLDLKKATAQAANAPQAGLNGSSVEKPAVNTAVTSKTAETVPATAEAAATQETHLDSRPGAKVAVTQAAPPATAKKTSEEAFDWADLSEGAAEKAPVQDPSKATPMGSEQALREGSLLLQSTAPIVEKSSIQTKSSLPVPDNDNDAVVKAQPATRFAERATTSPQMPEWAAEELSDAPLFEPAGSSATAGVAPRANELPLVAVTRRDTEMPAWALSAEDEVATPPEKQHQAAKEVEPEARVRFQLDDPFAEADPFGVVEQDSQPVPATAQGSPSDRKSQADREIQAGTAEISISQIVGEPQLLGWREISSPDIEEPAKLEPLLRMQVEQAAASTRDLRKRLLESSTQGSRHAELSHQPARSDEKTIELASRTLVEPVATKRPEDDRFAMLRSPATPVNPTPASHAPALAEESVAAKPSVVAKVEAAPVIEAAPRVWVALQTGETTLRNEVTEIAPMGGTMAEAGFAERALNWFREFPVRIRWIFAAGVVAVFSGLWWYGGQRGTSQRSL
ncbi:MAG: hypothetical protein C0478_12695 [Planctomyces sp.]|nr:hypothetical protein [Planctomyces sp.]